ncbi:F-box/kelch-repeat protein SKIP6 [Thalictrum thalictroides]|uniref:F-box/kelch-repeat protein SKIP6 n=1 Tax=Thalictrum thalictroides TaxID=46969 RepID=A0A7J6UXQ6_THATH|nr:F-box/kelch-repeat protein SKIP6 [Thalictrum thalictroides]
MTAAIDYEEEEVIEEQKQVKEDPVYLCFSLLPTQDSPASTLWYEMKPNCRNSYRSRYDEAPLDPVAKMPCNNTLCFGSVSLNSKLYVIGGEVEDTNNPSVSISLKDVYIFDRKSPESGWTKGPSMRSGKSFPKVIALDSKIYVIGCSSSHGCIEDAPKPYAEVYDPTLNSWEDLPEPPVDVHKNGWIDGYAVIENGSKILVSMYNGGAFTYDVKGKLWGQFSSKTLMERGGWFGRGAVIDHVMYSYYQGMVYGYDLSMNQWLEDPVLYLEEKVANIVVPDPPYHGCNSPCCRPPDEPKYLYPGAIPSGFVVNIGEEKLCMVWSSYRNRADRRDVHCLVFTPTVYYSAEQKIVATASIDYGITEKFIVEGQLFDDCFVP